VITGSGDLAVDEFLRLSARHKLTHKITSTQAKSKADASADSCGFPIDLDPFHEVSQSG
jgi:hypothetical protein